jgi:predicted RNase H-like HicB family nuclease
MRYAIVIETAENNYSAYVPDLPGCVATGASLEEVEAEIREAIEFHLEGMREDGCPFPSLRAGLNCHAVVHRREPPHTVEEVQTMLQ